MNLRLDIQELINVMLKDTMTKRQKKIMAPTELPICPCGVKAKDEYHETFFSYQNVDGKVDLYCGACAYKIHKEFIIKERKEGVGDKF